MPPIDPPKFHCGFAVITVQLPSGETLTPAPLYPDIEIWPVADCGRMDEKKAATANHPQCGAYPLTVSCISPRTTLLAKLYQRTRENRSVRSEIARRFGTSPVWLELLDSKPKRLDDFCVEPGHQRHSCSRALNTRKSTQRSRRKPASRKTPSSTNPRRRGMAQLRSFPVAHRISTR